MQNTPEFPAREIAAELPAREIAAEQRTFSEDEHTAILAATVKSETAALTDRVAELEAANASLLTEKAELEENVELEKAAKATVEAEFASFKGEVEHAAEVAARVEVREKAFREAAPHLPDTFFTPERAARWAELPEEDFNDRLAEVAATAPAADGARETAAATSAVKGEKVGGEKPAGRSLFQIHQKKEG